ncbi:MAG: hypothetical protein OXF41_11740 [bacterium]|nr:hypothetical protein [bacterium]
MSSLTSAHRGYEYQDLLSACRLVDMLRGDVVKVHVDKKLVPDDRFDDLTTVDIHGVRESVQVKHTDDDDRPLLTGTFTSDKRHLQLNSLVAAMVLHRSRFGSSANGQVFRVVLRDRRPTDPRLTSVLVPADPDPGPFIENMRTVRLAFDPEALWAQTRQEGGDDGHSRAGPFAFLGGSMSMGFGDLEWACRRLVIEVEAPAMSGDLTEPGLAEGLLLSRVAREVGAGVFPNGHRSPTDVAEALIRSARAGRHGHEVSRPELIRRAQLRIDFGAVSRAHPVDPSVEVLRPVEVDGLAREAESLAEAGGVLLAVGPPGQGKSWLCHQLRQELDSRGWLAVEHYCYLGDAEGERDERVLAERVFGSLVGRLAEADPRLVAGQQPRFAADERVLVDYIKRSVECEPTRRVALVVDGIDHITRVLGGRIGGSDPSRSLAEVLALMEVPRGTVLVVLSQPGGHLEPLEAMGATTVEVEGLGIPELRVLAAKLGLIPDVGDAPVTAVIPAVIDEADVGAFLDAVAERSAGNVLYATYLCGEMLRHVPIVGDPAAAVGSFPQYDESLEAYYSYLYSSLDPEGAWVADVIGFVDFAVTHSELCELRPAAAHRIGPALDVLGPVLNKRVAQGGVRVYHESFARYLRGRISDYPVARRALVEHVAGWLRQRGLFGDARAFHSLVPLLAAEGFDREAVRLVERDFVVRSVAAGFPTSAILRNLAYAIRCAASLGDWPLVARCVELSRSAETYQTEGFESSWVGFVDVPIALLGAATVAERFVHEHRLVMSAKAGLQVCAAIDAHRGAAPWREYMTGYVREVQAGGIADADLPDEEVSLAWLRGRLRLSAYAAFVEPEPEGSERSASSVASDPAGEGSGSGGERRLNLSAPIDWRRLPRWMERHGVDPAAVAAAVFDTHGVEGVVVLLGHLDQPGPMSLALAELLADSQTGPDVGVPREWAVKAAEHGLPPGALHRVIALGVPVEDIIPVPVQQARQQLLDLTRAVQDPSIVWENETLWAWLDACLVAAHLDPLGLSAAQGLIAGEGWYKCWLRFVIGLVRAEAAEDDERHVNISEAFGCLMTDVGPFAGDPRACDLYSIRHVISSTIKRALALVDDQNWAQMLHLLHEVGTSIETSLRGSINNPLPLDLLVEAAVNGSDTARVVTEQLLEDVIANESARRHYLDLAELHLLAARLAVASNNLPKATERWRSACALLSGYGWHKDITIFEVLNPVPALMEADPSRRRELVAQLQPLCERVPWHTDRKETDHAWTRWWTLAGKADPVAVARLAGSRLLSRCNNPDWVLHGALEDLWASWCESADPLLAALLRLTLDTPLHATDADVLSLLAEGAQQNGGPPDRLMIWLLARADERPVEYGSSNSDEILEADDHKIAGLNAAAETAGLPGVIPIRDYLNGASSHPDPSDRYPQSPNQHLAEDAPPRSFSPGAIGLAQAIRAWQTRPYKPESDEWSVDRFANVIVSRLLEVAEAGRADDAARALRPLARGFGSSDRVDLMQQIAVDLERSGHLALATITYTLGWTGATGGGIGRLFGGSAGIPALRQAIQLDAELTQRVIAEEIEHLIGIGYPTNGVSQALIHAFAVGAIKVPDRLSTDVAFEVWDEVCAVISDRAPVVHPSDEPQDPYEPEWPTEETTKAEVDLAFSLGTIASLSHVGRERKRRTLLAIRLLLEERPGLAAEAFQAAFGALREPATLSWLLQLLLKVRTEPRMTVLARCEYELSQHAAGPFLVVRALARRLLGDGAPPIPPPATPHPSLFSTRADSLWVPDNPSNVPPVTDHNADGFVQAMTRRRLRQAETVLPGLGDAVSDGFATAMHEDDRRHLLDRQLDAYADYGGERWPDAFLIREQTVEEILQETAAGGRAARAIAGAVVGDPVVWEDQLADMLVDDPAIPLAVEALRLPRPPILAPPPHGATVWIEASASAASAHQDLRATLDVQPASICWVADRGPFGGWRMIASAERRMYPNPEPLNHTEFCALRHRAVEFRVPDAATGLDRRPLNRGDIRWWRAPVGQSSQVRLPDGPVSVAALVAAADGPRLLGIPSPTLVPVPRLIALLNLQPAGRFTLGDSDGCGLVLVTWRSAYETPTNSIPRPRLVGSALMLRPDLFEQLEDLAGDRLTLRDFVEGEPELASDS